jgi:CPA1 family monovalent cation:H+ antiporter
MLRKNAKIDLLRSVPLFAECSKSELGAIAALADEVPFAAGSTLITQGERGREFIVIVEGDVEVRRNGRAVPIRGGSEFFGEMALLTKEPRNATVVALTPVRTLVITDRAFNGLLAEQQSIQAKLLRSLAARAVATDAS